MSKKQALSKEELKKINGGTPGTGDIATGPKGSGKKMWEATLDFLAGLFDGKQQLRSGHLQIKETDNTDYQKLF